jgi:hypothetical protein
MSLPAKTGREVVIAGISGGLSLISPANLPPRGLIAYRITCAALTGAYTYDSLRRNDEFVGEPAVRVALAAGATGAMFGSMGLWERWDSALHRWLVARGVSHPRLVIAAGTTATSLVSALLESRASQRDQADEVTEPSQTDPDPRLRALLAAILAETDDFSAPVLRQQLALARAEVWERDEGSDDSLPAFVGLAVAGAHDVARAVPHSFVFPVRAEFEHHGTTFGVAIDVQDGRLSSVTLEPAERSETVDDSAEDAWPATWPTVDQVVFRHEASTA